MLPRRNFGIRTNGKESTSKKAFDWLIAHGYRNTSYYKGDSEDPSSAYCVLEDDRIKLLFSSDKLWNSIHLYDVKELERMEKEEKEFKLPKKWIIKWSNEADFRKYIEPYCESMGRKLYYIEGSGLTSEDMYISVDDKDLWKGYTEITIEQFKKYVLNMEKGKKIIGYRAPFYINSVIGKGTLYVKHLSVGYCPKGKEGEGSAWYLPEEIVEKWDPVYEEEEIRIGGYKAEVTEDAPGEKAIAFGCKKFTLRTLEQWRRFLSDVEIQAKLTIHGQEITAKLIDSLLNMLK